MKRISIYVGTVVVVAAGVFVWWLQDEMRNGGGVLFTQEQLDAVTVARIIDGDTIEMKNGARVRYIGIDAPEAGQCFAAEATARNAELVSVGDRVAMAAEKQDKDDYGRLLRQVHGRPPKGSGPDAAGVFVNVALVEEGYARAIYIEPNVELYERLKAAESAARAARLGLWGACN